MLDKVTEMVAHMIGIFHITIEEGRMRDDYLKANARMQADADTGPLASKAPTLNAAYQLEDFTPRIRYEDAPTEAKPNYISAPLLQTPYLPIWWGMPSEGAPDTTIAYRLMADGPGRPVFTLEPPGGVVTISYQQAFLTDNDLLRLSDAGTVFVDPAHFDSQLQAYQAVAQAIHAPLSVTLPKLGESVLDHALALKDQISTIEAHELTGAEVNVVHGEAAIGIHENGVVVEVASNLDDVMPAYFKAQKDAEEQATSDDTDAPPDWAPDPFQGLDAAPVSNTLFTPDPGHEVVSGANFMMNQTNITSAWLDAPVIAVMGDVVNLNIIAQTNMLIEQGEHSGLGAALGSAAYNSAIFSTETSIQPPDENAEPASDGPLSLPSNWAVARVDGDLLTVNHSQQYSFVTDHDRADIGFYSANTYVALGDNTVVNLTSILEIGYGFDLIIIGGHMITINQISQMNVLVDNDLVTYDGLQPTQFSAGDNLLFNGAAINVVGQDSYHAMQDNFAAAAESFAQGALTIDESVAHDSVFEGTDILRVLYISGDAVTINLVDQTNILGDSDQVHLALDNFQSNTGAEISVTAGSNAAINVASISQFGVDSTVSVGGDVYSDALLYQAGFIDTAANPLGVALPALASEAVAFLADGMVGPDTADDMGITPPTIDGNYTPDVMQSMLA